MIIAVCILSLGLVFFAILSIWLFYGITHLEGQREQLVNSCRIDREVSDLCVRLVLEKFKYRLPLTERSLTEEIFKCRRERGEL